MPVVVVVVIGLFWGDGTLALGRSFLERPCKMRPRKAAATPIFFLVVGVVVDG